MLKNYFKIALRNLVKNRFSSSINIGGLAVGMAVAMLISLWIYDELSYEQYHNRYDRITQVMAHNNLGSGIFTEASLPIPLSAELRHSYGRDFEQVAATLTREQSIAFGDKAFSKTGCYAEPGFTGIITLDMLKGKQTALNDPGNILLSESLAKTIFGEADPLDQLIKLDGTHTLQVAGVYKDMPGNTMFSELRFLAPISVLFTNGRNMDNWHASSFRIYTLLKPAAAPGQVSKRIKHVLYDHTQDATKPALFVNPMRFWHLYEYKNGQLVVGRLQFVWLFGIIGLFVLLLACINFMNLSTARSEKRAKEVGIRKAIGSLRSQLIGQFLSESFLVVVAAFMVALLLVQFSLPLFNEVAGKQMNMVWTNPVFWWLSLAFCVFTGLLAGSYPAIYLSSFQPVKVLKGTFRLGRWAALPRKTLVVVQFTVSVTLIIGTLIVFRQIQFAKNRPVGYNKNHLITVPYTFNTQHYAAFRQELLQTNAVAGVAAASSPTTGIWSSADNLGWKGKDPNRQEMFGTILVDPDFGRVVGWQIKEGRNFDHALQTDSTCFLFNEAAISIMGLEKPLSETVTWHGKKWKIIGEVKDMVMTSPFDPIMPTVFLIDNKERSFNVVNIKMKAAVPVPEALGKIEAVFKKMLPGTPFNYRFADNEFAAKFRAEERIGRLAMVFTTLAIFISCLGLFGMASFVAEQRSKEIGIRKIIGASVLNLWGLLSKDFIQLVIISCFLAIPVAYYLLHAWLQNYHYRTVLSWWVFAAAVTGALLITLITVSFQAIKAALANPVKSLRTE